MVNITNDFTGRKYVVEAGVIKNFIIFRLYIIENNFFLKNLFLLLVVSSLAIVSHKYRYVSPLTHLLKSIDLSSEIYQAE
jgi:hypothetical protein